MEQNTYPTQRTSTLGAFLFLASIGGATIAIGALSTAWQTTPEQIKYGVAMALPIALIAVVAFIVIGLVSVAFISARRYDIPTYTEPVIRKPQIERQRIYELPPPAQPQYAPFETIF